MKFDSIIKYPIVEEIVEKDKYVEGVLTIRRRYKLPRCKLFGSPNDYISAFRSFDKAEFHENGLKIYTYLGGWGDSNCRSYWIDIILNMRGEG